nr:hypothetical protein [Paenibacillus taichungensis]
MKSVDKRYIQESWRVALCMECVIEIGCDQSGHPSIGATIRMECEDQEEDK